MFRTCYKCKVNKPLEDFYRNRARYLGRDYRCKVCDEARVRPYTYKSVRKVRRSEDELFIKYSKTKAGKAAIIRASVKAYQKFPEKWRTRAKTRAAIKKGLIIKQPCFCGEVSQAHHKDYAKYLEVTWLCTKHHSEHHVNNRFLTNYYLGL